MNNTTALFYGSLRKHFRNHDVARGARFVGHGQTLENFRLYVHFRQGEVGIPTAIPDATGYPLIGEVYDLPPRVAEQVGWLEDGYTRRKVDVKLNGLVLKNVLVYCCNSLDESIYRTAEEVEATTGDYADVCTPLGKRKTLFERPIDWTVEPIRSFDLLQVVI